MNIKALLEEKGRDGTIAFLLGHLEGIERGEVNMALIAIKHLMGLKAKEARHKLEELAQHSDHLLRHSSLEALFGIDEEKALPFILKAVKGDGDSMLRAGMAALLAESTKKEEAIRILEEALEDKQVDVRLAAAKSLGILGNTDGHRVALEVLENMKEKYDYDEISAAIEALAEIGINDERTIRAIEYFQKRECAAYQALERLGRKRKEG